MTGNMGEATSSASDESWPHIGRPRPNLYECLGVDIKASQESIRRSYLRLARIHHPDRHRGSLEAKRKAHSKFQDISAAFAVLSCSSRRQQYDLGLLDLLDVEDYLGRFQGLILTACGLGMSSMSSGSDEEFDSCNFSSPPNAHKSCDGKRWLLTAR